MSDPVLYERLVPDVVGVVASIGSTRGPLALYWLGVQERSAGLFDGSYFSGDGLVNLIPSAVNDGEVSAAAFTWLNGAGASRLKFSDAGGRAFRACVFTVDNTTVVTTPTFEYSDDDVAWTAVGTNAVQLIRTTVSGNYTTYVYEWSDVGVHAYWAAKRPAGTAATAVTEVWFQEFGATFSDIKEIRVYEKASGVRELYARVRPDDQPTASKPLSVTALGAWVETSAQRTGTLQLDVVVVGSDGRESAGVSVFRSAVSAVSPSQLFLSAGLNSNIPVSARPYAISMQNGLGAAYSLGGFTASNDDPITVYDMEGVGFTIVHDDAASNEGSKILTPTGANIAVGAGGFAHFVRKGASTSNFMLLWARDAAGYK
jgi:hypothetical protein